MIYRVEMRKDGSIVSCDVVETALKNGGLVCYTDADNKLEAIQKAKKQFESLKRMGQKLHEVRVAKNECPNCGRKPKLGRTYCARCISNAVKNEKERRGLSPAQLEARARETTEQNRQRLIELGRKSMPLAIEQVRNSANRVWDNPTHTPHARDRAALRQCLRAYDRDPLNFRAWLLAKLGKSEESAAHVAAE